MFSFRSTWKNHIIKHTVALKIKLNQRTVMDFFCGWSGVEFIRVQLIAFKLSHWHNFMKQTDRPPFVPKQFMIFFFQIVQKMHKGAALQTFLYLLLMRDSCHLNSLSHYGGQDPRNTKQRGAIAKEPLPSNNEEECDQLTLLQFYIRSFCYTASTFFTKVDQESKPFLNKLPMQSNFL